MGRQGKSDESVSVSRSKMNLSPEQRARLIELMQIGAPSDDERAELQALSFLAQRAGVLAEIQSEVEKAKAPVPAPAPAPAPSPAASGPSPAPSPAPAPAGTGLLASVQALVGTPRLMAEAADLRRRNGELTAQSAQLRADLTIAHAEIARLGGVIAEAEAKIKSIAAGVTDELAGVGHNPKELPAPGGAEGANLGTMTDAEFSKHIAEMSMSERIAALRKRDAAKKKSSNA